MFLNALYIKKCDHSILFTAVLQDQVLLAACTETTSLSTSSSSISSQVAGVGHYLLLPSSSSLLIKPVVVSELLLPVETAGEGDKPTPDAMDSIAASLDQVSHLHKFFITNMYKSGSTLFWNKPSLNPYCAYTCLLAF